MRLSQFIRYFTFSGSPRPAVAAACLIAGTFAWQACVGLAAQPQADATAVSPSWMRGVEKAPFSPRDTAEDAVFHGKMWLSNGYVAGGKLVRDLWSSSDGVTWELVRNNTPYDGYSEMVVYDGKLWAVKASAWNSSDGVTWKQVCRKTPFGARGYGELVVFRGRMWQLGSGNDVWSTTDGVKWERASANAPFGPRYGSAVTACGDKLWLIGGATFEASNPPEKHYPKYTTHNDVWCSSDGMNWNRVLEHARWAERMWLVSKVYAGKLWIIGGFIGIQESNAVACNRSCRENRPPDGRPGGNAFLRRNSNRKSINFAEAWYTKDGKTWQEYKSASMFSPRHEVTPYVFNGSLWVVGGNSWPLMNDVWRLTLPIATIEWHCEGLRRGASGHRGAAP